MRLLVGGSVRVVAPESGSWTIAGREARVAGVLALHRDHSVSVDTLIDALWSEPPATSRKAVLNALSRLRGLTEQTDGLSTGLVERSGERYRLGRGVTTDVGDWERALQAGDESAAFDLDPQQWFEVLGSWVPAVAERTRLSLAALDAQERWAENRLSDTATLPFAIERLRSMTEAEPYREARWLLLMTALSRADRQVDALRAYQAARAVLLDGVGVEPGPSLRRAEQAVLAQRDPLLGTLVDRRALTSAIVGRTEELDRLRSRIDTDRHHWVVIRGAPGVGKTTLARAESERRRAEGDRVVWLGLDGGNNPIEELWRELTATQQPATLDPTDLAGHVAYELMRDTRRTMLVVDDLHAAGIDVIDALRALRRALRGRSVTVVSTVRSADLGASELKGWLSDLDAEGAVLELAGLAPEALAELLAIDDARAFALHKYCGGNTLHAIELTVAGHNVGEEPPTTVARRVVQRIELLGEAASRFARTAAVAGTTFDPGIVATASKMTGADVATAIDRLSATGLVDFGGSGRARFTHPLTPEALRSALKPTALEEHHGALWAAMETLGKFSAIDMAPHALGAARLPGRRAAAVSILAAAGHVLLERGRYAIAAQRIEEALVLHGRADLFSAELRLDLGIALGHLNRPLFKRVLLDVAIWAQQAGELAIEVSALLAANRGWPEHYSRTSDDEMIGFLRRVRLRTTELNREQATALAACEASERFWDKDGTERVTAAAVARHDLTAAVPRLRLYIGLRLLAAEWDATNAKQRVADLPALAELAMECGSRCDQVFSLYALSASTAEVGDRDAAERHMTRALARVSESDDAYGRFALAHCAVLVATLSGQLDDALARLDDLAKHPDSTADMLRIVVLLAFGEYGAVIEQAGLLGGMPEAMAFAAIAAAAIGLTDNLDLKAILDMLLADLKGRTHPSMTRSIYWFLAGKLAFARRDPVASAWILERIECLTGQLVMFGQFAVIEPWDLLIAELAEVLGDAPRVARYRALARDVADRVGNAYWQRRAEA